ncbi:PREDICTED: EF-hand calcium-binding domain-containing protein 4B-like [Priapulus caudatus]|uniref:EF-hand calcium-binding domain-containing protein 4B-like n=1 Tax=Priapulus caudatus TaxID=37621 RepID=A0ABM1DUR4_PRICU|nr:PREDICTED: EF-hand calcium-binding domain-containing protein 4B-like [Priapulus caudatus]
METKRKRPLVTMSSVERSKQDLENMVAQKARELFDLCDRQETGYITRTGIMRLEGELPLTASQLCDVFDLLETDNRGFLTLKEFTKGFIGFMDVKFSELDDDFDNIAEPGMVATCPTPAPIHSRSVDVECLAGVDDIVIEPATMRSESYVWDGNSDEDEGFQKLMQHLGGNDILNEEEQIRELWLQLRRDEPHLLDNFEDFLGRMASLLKRSELELSSLQSAIKTKCTAHDQQVRVLYEEMEQQISEEREKLIAAEKARERRRKLDMKAEFEEKEQQLQNILCRQVSMEKKLEELNSAESQSRQQNELLASENEDLRRALVECSAVSDDSSSADHGLSQLRVQQRLQRRSRAEACVKVSESIANDRVSLLQQLELLRKMNEKLSDDKDEIEERMNAASGNAAMMSTPSASPDSIFSSVRLDKQGAVFSDYVPSDKGERQNKTQKMKQWNRTWLRKLNLTGVEIVYALESRYQLRRTETAARK